MTTVQDLLTPAELARLLKLHRNTVGKLLAQGRFPHAFRLGRHWRIPLTDVQAFMHAHAPVQRGA